MGIAGPHQLNSCQNFNLLKQITNKQTDSVGHTTCMFLFLSRERLKRTSKHTHHFPSSNYCVQRLNSQEKTIPRLIFVFSRNLLPERPPLKSILSIKRDTTAMNVRILHRNFNWDQPFFLFSIEKNRN